MLKKSVRDGLSFGEFRSRYFDGKPVKLASYSLPVVALELQSASATPSSQESRYSVTGKCLLLFLSYTPLNTKWVVVVPPHFFLCNL